MYRKERRMKDCKSYIYPKGYIDIIVENMESGKIIHRERQNTVLLTGRSALARGLANEFTGTFEFYVNSMVFGTSGEDANVPRKVDPGRESLYSSSEAAEVSVTKDWSADYPDRSTFTGKLLTTHAVGLTLNEAALKLANGDLFSMVTFGGLSKTNQLQFTLNWTIVIA